MKKFIQRLFLIIAPSLFIMNCLYALPGVTQTLPDQSGEYVFYRDNSFMRESYIGFLYYDDATYQARYYAPAISDTDNLLPPKNMEILFSIDAAKEHLELTGERFLTPPAPEDTEIINYIHDLLYELTERRVKAGELSLAYYSRDAGTAGKSAMQTAFMEAGKRTSETYAQFGGDVTIIYDAVVPIFNLKKIVNYEGKDVFFVVTTGRLNDSYDRSFSNFVPKSQVAAAPQPSGNLIATSANKTALECTMQLNEKQRFEQTVQADETWQQQSETMWTLGDAAFIFLSALRFPDEMAAKDSAYTTAQVVRRLAESKEGSYCDWTSLEVYIQKDRIKLTSRTYSPQSGSVLADIKTLGCAAVNFYGYFSLTAFADGYQKNRGYFDQITKNYTFKIAQN